MPDHHHKSTFIFFPPNNFSVIGLKYLKKKDIEYPTATPNKTALNMFNMFFISISIINVFVLGV